ncbi:conjugal transfer protein [Marinactinospora thermotolerans]|uniref:Conjugative transposon protein TcpC n=1 Tax=Marinactinospora thermotolerans DSM 45154 TaxID=1122192 RepID=A0A1T4SXX6_9ACTN|nr:conjugal transfer protein [Marinactinospora thermotolerans]SKA33002.1 Conjugative transposon protein TcpC [Marinactinospora thermotolerans DSM 45154]
MARKSTARRGGALDEGVSSAPPADAWDDAPVKGRRPRRPRAGAGGRWWVWVGRALLWAFILVVLINGIWMPFRSGIAQAPAGDSEATETVDFPETAAAAFALRFSHAYLNADPDQAQERAAALAEFVPEGRASALALDGAALTGENIEVLGVDVQDENNAVVRVSADVNDTPMSLDVPVYAAPGGDELVVSGEPALLAAPGRAELPATSEGETDAQARGELEPILEGFFEAYAETPEHLSRYVESEARITPLPADTLTFAQLRDVVVPAGGSGGEDVRQVRATVVWRLAGSEADLSQSYRLTVVRDGDWYVRDIQGASNSFGS